MSATWIGLAIALLTAFIAIWKWWIDKERKREEKRKEITDDFKKAIVDKDISAITVNFDRLKRLR